MTQNKLPPSLRAVASTPSSPFSLAVTASAFVVFSSLGALWSPVQAQSTVVLTAQTASNMNGYWRDIGGALVRDSSGACVRAGYFTNDMANPDCGARPAASAPAPVVYTPVPVPPPAPGSAYWKDANGAIVRSGSGECVRAGFFTKELATVDCDPSLMPKPVAVAPAPAAVVAPAPAAAPVAAPSSAQAKIPEVVPAPRAITFRADAFFDFDKSTVKPEGQAALKNMIEQAKGATIEQVRVEGHTDAVGSAKYNIGLSVRRAEAVKKFLVQEGIPANKVVTEGVGEAQPVASNATGDGRALNRRVEVEFVGSRIAK